MTVSFTVFVQCHAAAKAAAGEAAVAAASAHPSRDVHGLLAERNLTF